MNRMTKRITKIAATTTMFLAVLTLITYPNFVSSVNLTDEQVIQVKNNCVTVTSTLNQLHASDALLRVNSGQIYESLSTKLMDKFNSRIANNHYGNSTLVSITTNYKTTLDTFRRDYINYEEQLTRALDTDCESQPVAFYDAVASARVKRVLVYADVAKLNQYIEDYKAAVAQFELDYQAVNAGADK